MKQKGFTLIELVIVIVILGILAATALPKFIDLSTDARKAAIRAVDGSMRAANTLIYARAAIDGKAANSSGTVSINGGNVSTVYGFAASTTALFGMMDIGPDFTQDNTFTGQVNGSGNAEGRIYFTKATTPTDCAVLYDAAAGSGQTPRYQLIDSGC